MSSFFSDFLFWVENEAEKVTVSALIDTKKYKNKR